MAAKRASILVLRRWKPKSKKSVSFNKICECSDGAVKGLKNDSDELSQKALLELGLSSDYKNLSENWISDEMADNAPGKSAPKVKQPATKVKCKMEGCNTTFAKYGKHLENHRNTAHGNRDKSIILSGQFAPPMALTQAMAESQPLETLEEGDETNMEVETVQGKKKKAVAEEGERGDRMRNRTESESTDGLSIAASDNISSFGDNDDTMVEGLCGRLEEAKGEIQKREKWTGDLESENMDLKEQLQEAAEQIDKERSEANRIIEGLKEELRNKEEKIVEKEREKQAVLATDMKMVGRVLTFLSFCRACQLIKRPDGVRLVTLRGGCGVLCTHTDDRPSHLEVML